MSIVDVGARRRLRETLEASPRAGARFVALRVAFPAGRVRTAVSALRLFETSDSPLRFYWERPDTERAAVGLGAVARLESSGDRRFETLSDDVRSLFASLVTVGSAAPQAAGPLLMGGFAFAERPAATGAHGAADWEGFAPTSFALPRLAWVRDGGRGWLTACAALEGGVPSELEEALIGEIESAALELDRVRAWDDCVRPPSLAGEFCARPDRPHAAYLEGVEKALGALARGELEKVVLARSLTVESDLDYGTTSVLESLRAAHPACTVFAVTRGERSFIGATPERLVSLDAGRVLTSAVAGSAPRGRSPEEDARLARALRESKKEQEEHAVVVREIEAALAGVCEGIERPEAPRVLGLDGIQHLETPFEARLRTRGAGRPSAIDLAAALHPTPAVCGTPRDAALEWIARAENLERGWYAGAIGWLEAGGGGDLSVALRSGLVAGPCARLYAGAGIVGGSDPRAELAETRLKLRALLSQLTEI